MSCREARALGALSCIARQEHQLTFTVEQQLKPGSGAVLSLNRCWADAIQPLDLRRRLLHSDLAYFSS